MREPWTGKRLFDAMLHEAERARNPFNRLSASGKAKWNAVAARIEREIVGAATSQPPLTSDGQQAWVALAYTRTAGTLAPVDRGSFMMGYEAALADVAERCGTSERDAELDTITADQQAETRRAVDYKPGGPDA